MSCIVCVSCGTFASRVAWIVSRVAQIVSCTAQIVFRTAQIMSRVAQIMSRVAQIVLKVTPVERAGQQLPAKDLQQALCQRVLAGLQNERHATGKYLDKKLVRYGTEQFVCKQN